MKQFMSMHAYIVLVQISVWPKKSIVKSQGVTRLHFKTVTKHIIGLKNPENHSAKMQIPLSWFRNGPDTVMTDAHHRGPVE